MGKRVISIMGEMGRAFDGGYAEYVLLPNEQIYPVETKLDWISLTALPESYYTAFRAYKSLNISAGNKVLVRGAASGLGPATVKNSLKHTKEYGIVCSCGQLGGKWYLEEFDPIMELHSNKYLTTSYSGDVSEDKIQEMINFVEQYNIEVKPVSIFKLDEVAKAHELMETGKTIGKNIVIIE